MTNSNQRARPRRSPQLLVALSGLVLIASGCEKLVGISDTQVTNDATAGASGAGTAGNNADAGKAGMSHAGADTGAGPTSDAGAPSETGGSSSGGETAGN